MADSGQKTEQPTKRRLEKARKEGQFPVSREFVSAVQFLTFVALAAAWGPDWMAGIQNLIRTLLAEAFAGEATAAAAVKLGREVLGRLFLLFAPLGAALLIATLAVQMATTGLGVSPKKLAPELKRLNPLPRLKQMPNENLTGALQALLLMPIFGGAVWVVARDNMAGFLALPLQHPAAGARAVGAAVLTLLWKAAAVFLVFGCVDLLRRRRRWANDLRMSKQEIREELKDMEGNPQVKGRIRRLQRDFARRRMMQEVPKATAVVVNPTHYAVAIRYAMDSMPAPVVVAKGRNYLARRIRERAVAHGVPIVENPPLAQALYKSAEVGQEIPANLYRAVAEILAYIFRLMKGRPPGR
jgi:flagellar biosynthesis protein FlhB